MKIQYRRISFPQVHLLAACCNYQQGESISMKYTGQPMSEQVLLHSEPRNAMLLHRSSTQCPTSVPKTSTPCKMDDLFKTSLLTGEFLC